MNIHCLTKIITVTSLLNTFHKKCSKAVFLRYYTLSDHPDLSDGGDLSWDEGDLPHQEIKVPRCFKVFESKY